FAPTQLAIQYSVPKNAVGTGNSLVWFVSNLGGSIVVSLLATFQGTTLKSLYPAPPTSPAALAVFQSQVHVAWASSIQDVWWWLVPLAIAGFLFALWMNGRLPKSEPDSTEGFSPGLLGTEVVYCRLPSETTMIAAPIAPVELRLRSHDGLALMGSSWRPSAPPRAVLVLVHGLKDHTQRYGALASRANSLGVAVYGFDLRGHGRSGGPRAWVRRFEEYLLDLDLVRQEVARRHPG
ncbi:MAG: alpha/beta hydrolase, partial [Thermoplasmata archaeon]|nr:alpha/beta hydrolase [Thermoplasmata archaeon]